MTSVDIYMQKTMFLKKNIRAETLLKHAFCDRATATLHPLLFRTGFFFVPTSGWATWLAGWLAG